MLSLFLCVSTVLAAQDLKLSASDGTRLHALAWRARSNRGVILVHGKDQSADIWNSVGESLSGMDVTALSVDLRGHGESKGGDSAELTETDFSAMSQDILAASEWMDRHGIEQITCVGAGLGANLCLQAAASSTSIDRVALLSPGFNYEGVTSIASAAQIGQRSMLLMFSDDDSYAMQTSMVLADRASGPVRVEARSGLGHGTRMLARDPDFEILLVDWLSREEAL